MRPSILAIVFVVGSAIISGAVLAEGVQLKGDALVMSISGKTYTGTTQRGGTWEATYSNDGTFQVRVLNSSWSDKGTWEVKEDMICSERSERSYMCYQLMRVSDDEFHWVDERGETQKSSAPR